MIESTQHFGKLMLMLGAITLLTIPIKTALGRLGLPSVIGFILIGLGLSATNEMTSFMDERLWGNIEFLAQIGIVALLFRVGIESDLDLLLSQLGNAAAVWLPNVVVPAVLTFAVIHYLLGFELLPSIYAGVAASATSIGVSAAVWEDSGAIDTPEAALMLDTAELDDLSAVVMLSVLFAVAPSFLEAEPQGAFSTAMIAGLLQLGKVVLFCAGCYIFSRYMEPPISAMFAELDKDLGAFVLATGVVFVIAAAADLLGLSVAVGALFAGLAFSRDSKEREIDDAFAKLLVIFGPLFFIAIGLAVDVTLIWSAFGLGLAFFATASLGKIIGAGLPTALLLSPRSGWLIGVSMIPRAEIFLIIMLHGLTLGAWAVPPNLYAAAVIACIGTCLVGPIIVNGSLARTKPHRRAG